MKRKKMYLILISTAVLLIIAAFYFGFRINSTSLARVRLEREISSLESKTDEIELSKEEINNTINDLETELSTKDTMNNYYMEYQKQHDQLAVDIDTLKKESASLDAQIAEKQNSMERNSDLKSGTRGKTYTLKKDEAYTCPDKIPVGRYIITGRGSLVIYSASGKVRATINLDVAYGNSYTFDLAKNEQIKVGANATMTELK